MSEIQVKQLEDDLLSDVPEEIPYDEAVEESKKLLNVQETIRYADRLLDFRIGILAKRVNWPNENVTDAKKEYAEELGINLTKLYECVRLVEEFNESGNAYLQWIQDKEEEIGEVPKYYHVQSKIGANTNPDVLGKSGLVERFISRTERMARDLQKLNALDLTDEQERSARGAFLKAREELDEFRNETIEKLEHSKDASPRSEEYISFIKKFPCCITGAYPVEAAHTVGRKGTSTKTSDFSCVPLDPDLHRSEHTLGKVSFWEEHGYNPHELVANYQHYFMTSQFLDLDLPEPLPY